MKQSKQKGCATADELFREAELKEERRDYRGAFKSLLTAARTGDTGSQINLGNYYAAGRGVEKNLHEAARWYKSAYRNGSSIGALNLAVDLEKQGKMRSAVLWLKRAVAMNEGDAFIRLARIYLRRPKGVKSAADLLQRAVCLSCSDISDDSREQAEALLKLVEKTSN